MLAFYVIGLLYNREIEDYEGQKNTLIAICVGFIVLTIKGFWGMANPPFYNNEGARVFFCVICTVLEILVIIALAVSINNLKDTAAQRNKFFYDEEYQSPTPLPQSQPAHHPTEDNEDIYEEMTDRF
jgi:biotin transporter BioY